MKKTILVALVCLFLGVSASAALIKPTVLKEKKSEIVKAKKKLFRVECMSFTWTPECQTMPMQSSICSGPEGLPTDFYELWLLVNSVMDDVEGVLCP